MSDTTTGGSPLSDTVRRIAPRYALLVLLALMFVLFSLLSPDTFPTWANVKAMITSQTLLLLLCLAVLFPLRAGDFDLTIGATMVMCASVLA